jgi:peptidoglycan L-alanyl-D-glutamate endopeptidase CwlK
MSGSNTSLPTGFGAITPDDEAAEADARSERALAGVHPTVATKARQLLERCRAIGIRLCITSGFRSREEQDRLYAQGRTAPGEKVTRARGGMSWHNWGLAFDVAVLDDRGHPSWPDDDVLWDRIGQVGEDLDLQWGGRFREFRDRPHFQMTFGLNLGALSAGDQVVPT